MASSSAFPTEAFAFTFGIATHLFVFNHSEHHLWPMRWLLGYNTLLASIVFGLTRFFDFPLGLAITSSLLHGTSFLAGLLFSLLTYRLFFNPINAFPGTFFSRITKFDLVFRVVKKLDNHKVLSRFHQEQGQFVRLGPGELTVTHPDAMQIMHGPHSKFIKSPGYSLDYPGYSLQTVRDHHLHDQKRRIWAPAFSDKSLRGYEGRIKVYSDLLVGQINSHLGQRFDLTKWFSFYGFDVMGDIGFGAPFDMLSSGQRHWAIDILKGGSEIFGYVLPPWFLRLLIAIPGLAKERKRFDAFCQKQLDARIARQSEEGDGLPDIAQHLISGFLQRPDKEQAAAELLNDTKLVIIAGSDTTSAALTNLWYYIASNKEVFRKLREEIERTVDAEDSTGKGRGEITNLKLKDAEYLNGCINEALRLHPAIPGGMSRKSPKEGIVIGGRFVPGNTAVQIPPYVLGHERIYPHASEFIPERWSSREAELLPHKENFQPFSMGRYGCIGKYLALMEIRLLTAQMVTTFDVELAPGETGHRLLKEDRDTFVLALPPFEVVFRERKF